MGIINGQSFAEAIANIKGLSQEELVLLRLIAGRSGFISAYNKHVREYLTVFLAVDDSKPSATPPTDISAERHNHAKFQLSAFSAEQAHYLSDLSTMIKGGGFVMERPTTEKDAIADALAALNDPIENSVKCTVNLYQSDLYAEVRKGTGVVGSLTLTDRLTAVRSTVEGVVGSSKPSVDVRVGVVNSGTLARSATFSSVSGTHDVGAKLTEDATPTVGTTDDVKPNCVATVKSLLESIDTEEDIKVVPEFVTQLVEMVKAFIGVCTTNSIQIGFTISDFV